MTKGTMTTKGGENTLKVENVTLRPRGWGAQISGDSDRYRHFLEESWYFIEDMPTPYEQYQGMKQGTIFFNTWHPDLRYLKISDEKYYSFLSDRVLKVGPYKFEPIGSLYDTYTIEEQ